MSAPGVRGNEPAVQDHRRSGPSSPNRGVPCPGRVPRAGRRHSGKQNELNKYPTRRTRRRNREALSRGERRSSIRGRRRIDRGHSPRGPGAAGVDVRVVAGSHEYHGLAEIRRQPRPTENSQPHSKAHRHLRSAPIPPAFAQGGPALQDKHGAVRRLADDTGGTAGRPRHFVVLDEVPEDSPSELERIRTSTSGALRTIINDRRRLPTCSASSPKHEEQIIRAHPRAARAIALKKEQYASESLAAKRPGTRVRHGEPREDRAEKARLPLALLALAGLARSPTGSRALYHNGGRPQSRGARPQ